MSFISWDGPEVLVGICSPFDIVDVGIVLRIRVLDMLSSSTGDVGEWCLRLARHARVSYTS